MFGQINLLAQHLNDAKGATLTVHIPALTLAGTVRDVSCMMETDKLDNGAACVQMYGQMWSAI